MQDVLAVGAFRRRGQSQQHTGLQMGQQPGVRRSLGMMELVDNDHVEVVGLELAQIQLVQ